MSSIFRPILAPIEQEGISLSSIYVFARNIKIAWKVMQPFANFLYYASAIDVVIIVCLYNEHFYQIKNDV